MKKILFYLFTLISLPQLIASTIDTDTKERAQHYLKNKPVRFWENKGQMTDMANKPVPFVLFKAEAPGMNMYITEKGITYVFIKAEEEEQKVKKGNQKEEKIEVEWNRVDMNLKGASIKKENIIKEGQSTDFKQYFLGHCPNGITDVRSYEKITIKEIYPGIDWVLYNSNNKGFKYDFIVHSGANAKDITIVYNSQKPIKLNEQGELKIKTKLGNLTENKPYSYIQETNTEIKSAFNISEKRVESNHYETFVTIELPVNEVLSKQTIVIDPQLVWATFIGGNDTEYLMASDFDDNDNLYITGYTNSINFPTVSSGLAYFANTNAGSIDILILKFTNTGALLWSTYYGGNISDYGIAICHDATGNIFITGNTNSANLPLFNPGGGVYFQPTNGFTDAFILKLSMSGIPEWCTFYGGNAGSIKSDYGTSICTDGLGNVFVTGATYSSDFPVLNPGGGAYFQATTTPSGTIFILKFNNMGVLLWATLFGGNSSDHRNAICTDPFGNIFVVGHTASTDFPVLDPGGGAYFQGNLAGPEDIIILKFNNSGVLLWSTLYGGDNTDDASSICSDSFGNIFIVGFSNSNNFPVVDPGFGAYFKSTKTPGGATNGPWTASDLILLKFSNTGTIIWSTYYGGTGNETLFFVNEPFDNIGVDACNNVYVNFHTQSTDLDLKEVKTNCISYRDTTFNGQSDLAILKFSNVGKLLWSTYFDGIGDEVGSSLAIDKSNNLFVAGGWLNINNSNAYPLIDPGLGAYFNNSFSGTNQAYIAKFRSSSSLLTVTPTITAAGCGCAGTASVTATGGCVTTYKYKWYNGSGSLIGTTQNLSNLCAGNYKVLVSDTINCSVDSITVAIAGGGGSIPINSITANAANCNGAATGSASVTVTNASATYTYSWSNGTSGTTTATQFTATNLLAGIYTVTVSDGSCSNTSTVSITSPPSIILGSITPTASSCGQSNGTAVTAIATGGTGTLTYSWSNGNSGQTATNLSAQTYTLTVRDANNCSTTTTVNIGNTGGASISSVTKVDALCSGGTGSATVNITGGASGNYTYSWSNGANTITTSTSNQALLTSNSYTVTVIDGSCNVTSVITITEPSSIIPSAVQISPASCGFNNGIATASATGGSGVFDYIWTSGATGPTAYNLAAATYTVTVSDGNFCTKTTTVNIGNTALVINSLTSVNALCNGSTGSATVTIAASTAPYTYSWSNGASTIATATSNQALLTSNTYTVTVTDANNCSTTTSITINNTNSSVNATVTSTISSNTISEGESIVLSGGGGTSYTWTPNNSLSCATCPVTIANPTATTTYTLIAKDNLGCADTTDITINVKKPCTGEEDVFIANVFSPNNDGKNDLLLIQGNGLTNIYFSIYDRWGNLMFETRDQAQGWDGSLNGNTANAGTYVYYLKATCKKTLQEIILKGNVSVLK